MICNRRLLRGLYVGDTTRFCIGFRCSETINDDRKKKKITLHHDVKKQQIKKELKYSKRAIAARAALLKSATMDHFLFHLQKEQLKEEVMSNERQQ